MKTPQDTVKELVEKMSEAQFIEYASEYTAIKCAKIAVDEILASYKSDYELKIETTYWHPYDFWQKVRNHLDKM